MHNSEHLQTIGCCQLQLHLKCTLNCHLTFFQKPAQAFTIDHFQEAWNLPNKSHLYLITLSFFSKFYFFFMWTFHSGKPSFLITIYDLFFHISIQPLLYISMHRQAPMKAITITYNTRLWYLPQSLVSFLFRDEASTQYPCRDSIHWMLNATIYWMRKLTTQHSKPPRRDRFSQRLIDVQYRQIDFLAQCILTLMHSNNF